MEEIDVAKRTQEVDQFVMVNKNYFPEESMFTIRDALMKAEQRKFDNVKLLSFKEPITVLLLSIFLGGFGVDRFYIGDTGMGVLKLLLLNWVTCGIFPLVDIFLSFKRNKQKNLLTLLSAVQ